MSRPFGRRPYVARYRRTWADTFQDWAAFVVAFALPFAIAIIGIGVNP